MRSVARWLDDRLALARFANAALNRVFPDHWSFMIGEIALYCLVILILTGTYLTFFFEASSREVIYQGPYEPLRGVEMSAAYRSALELTFEVRAGLVMRQIHHWAALLFVAALVVHLARVFFTGAFRRPRELNWMVGLTMLILALLNGFFGYSLPDDLLSGTGLRIAYSVVLSVPVRGTWLACRAVIPDMRKRGYGKIVNISSGTALKGSASRIHYVTSKAGVLGFTRTLAREVGKDGICVNCVVPGSTLSEEKPAEDVVRMRTAAADERALKRVQRPEDLVGAVLFFASADSDFVTGQSLVVDGGAYMQ